MRRRYPADNNVSLRCVAMSLRHLGEMLDMGKLPTCDDLCFGVAKVAGKVDEAGVAGAALQHPPTAHELLRASACQPPLLGMRHSHIMWRAEHKVHESREVGLGLTFVRKGLAVTQHLRGTQAARSVTHQGFVAAFLPDNRRSGV